MLELIDHVEPSEETAAFSFPSNPRKQIIGPDDLTREQAKALGRLMKDAQGADDDDFFATVFLFWATLPGSTWNLSRKGQQLPLTTETLQSELKKGDFSSLAIEVTRHLYPYMFEKSDEGEAGSDDVMDGLVAEEGSQAAEEVAAEGSDPNP